MKKQLLLLLIIYLTFIFSSCGKDEAISASPVNKSKHPQLAINKFSLTFTNAGKIEWIFWAKEASVYDEKNMVESKDIEITFFTNNKNKTISSNLKAIEGNINTKTNDMEAMGNVVIASENGNKLFTEKVKWFSASQKFYTEEKVRLEKGDDILTGLGMEADPSLDNIRILKEVKVEARE